MTPTGRIMALDYGEKRIGVALSDPLRIFAKPYQVISNTSPEDVLESVNELISAQAVSLVLVGMPWAIDGSETPKTTETKAFATWLSAALAVPVEVQDERYSTCEAEAELKKLGYSWQEARNLKDAMAACIFLKEYLSTL